MSEISLNLRELDNAHWNSHGSLVYVGSSMYPTLKAPEIIYFDRYADRDVRPGDIVVFNDPATGASVTHRVISVTPDGIRTRGDNNNRVDPRILKKEDLAGRVVFARRDRRYRHMRGGLYGLITRIHCASDKENAFYRHVHVIGGVSKGDKVMRAR